MMGASMPLTKSVRLLVGRCVLFDWKMAEYREPETSVRKWRAASGWFFGCG